MTKLLFPSEGEAPRVPSLLLLPLQSDPSQNQMTKMLGRQTEVMRVPELHGTESLLLANARWMLMKEK
jgi:hypothetical protein